MDQKTADYLIKLEKMIIGTAFVFPLSGEKITLDLTDLDGREKFLLDVNRRGRLILSRCTFQKRYQSTTILIRLDLDNHKVHMNPNHTKIIGPHIHIYRENYDDKWAYSLEKANFPEYDRSELSSAFYAFCDYCNIKELPNIQQGMRDYG